jgi:quercetin dioxygenase-like cupin family protein
MRRNLTLNTVSILLLAAVTSSAQDSTVSKQVAEDDKPFLLTYPNLENSDGEVVLTNDHVVLQRLVVGPGEWEGIHSHPGNQVYIHIKSGTWSERRRGVQSAPSPFLQADSVGWVDAIDLGEAHEVGNTGDTTIEFVLVTIK